MIFYHESDADEDYILPQYEASMRPDCHSNSRCIVEARVASSENQFASSVIR